MNGQSHAVSRIVSCKDILFMAQKGKDPWLLLWLPSCLVPMDFEGSMSQTTLYFGF